MAHSRSAHDPHLLPDGLKFAFLALVEQRFGLAPSDHQIRQLHQVVENIVAQTTFPDASTLLAALTAGGHPELLELIAAQLSVGETHFFRVLPQIEALRNVVLPDLMARKAPSHRLRVWSAGCSTGEEAYTLAILLRELPLAHWTIDLIGSDVSRASLASAEQGLYGEWSFRETPARVRASYFTEEGKRWRLDSSIRDMVRFHHSNLVDAIPVEWLQPFAFDLIVCRNVTIYFGDEMAGRAYAHLERALEPEGWLVLGPSDPAPDRASQLEPVFLPGAVLWRRSVPGGEPMPGRSGRRLGEGPAGTKPGPRSFATPGGTRIGRAPVRGGGPSRPERSPRSERYRHDQTGIAEPPPAGSSSVDPEEHLVEGLRDLDAGSLATAVESLRRSIFLAQNPLAHLGLSLAFLRLGKLERALGASLHARRLLAALPDEAEISGGRGATAGEVRHAVDAQLQALRSTPRGRSGGTY